jgi:hypothetical protein
MNKIIVLAIVAAFGLIACGDSKPPATPPAKETKK